MEMEYRVEALDDAIFSIREAIDAIKRLGRDYATDAEVLGDICRNYEGELADLNREIEAENAANDNAIMRDYYRGVM